MPFSYDYRLLIMQIIFLPTNKTVAFLEYRRNSGLDYPSHELGPKVEPIKTRHVAMWQKLPNTVLASVWLELKSY